MTTMIELLDYDFEIVNHSRVLFCNYLFVLRMLNHCPARIYHLIWNVPTGCQNFILSNGTWLKSILCPFNWTKGHYFSDHCAIVTGFVISRRYTYSSSIAVNICISEKWSKNCCIPSLYIFTENRNMNIVPISILL